MADLTTRYMSLELKNPVIVASCGLTKDLEGLKKCEVAGAGAVVLKSIFEEQFLVKEDAVEAEYAVYPEALDYMRSGGLLEYAPLDVCRMIEVAKTKVGIPVIASVNCRDFKLWPSYAKQLEDAGADGLELNVYFLPIDPETPGSKYEDDHVRILDEVKNSITIPVSMKLTHQITAVPHLAGKLADHGCDGLVFFNWFLEPDINVETLKTRNVKGQGNLHKSLRWIAILAGRLGCDISASGGVKKAEDLVKLLLAGASTVHVCTLLYQKGLSEIEGLLNGLRSWMAEHQYSSVDDLRGELSLKKQELSFKDMGEAEAFFRAQYLKAYSK